MIYTSVRRLTGYALVSLNRLCGVMTVLEIWISIAFHWWIVVGLKFVHISIFFFENFRGWAGPKCLIRVFSFSIDTKEEAVLLLLLFSGSPSKTKIRVYAPGISWQLTYEQFPAIRNNIKAHTAQFFNYFRMSQGSFNYIITLLKPHI